MEQEKIFQNEELKRKEEEKMRIAEERVEKRAREKLRKEENQRERERRKQLKELAQAERQQRESERKRVKAEKETAKARRELERAIRPIKSIKREEKKSTRPLTPLTYDSDSTLSSPSLSDLEFASLVESEPRKWVPETPSTIRVIEYLPTPAPTPEKAPLNHQEQDSPLKRKRNLCMEEIDGTSNNGEPNKQRRDSMSIRFLVDSD